MIDINSLIIKCPLCSNKLNLTRNNFLSCQFCRPYNFYSQSIRSYIVFNRYFDNKIISYQLTKNIDNIQYRIYSTSSNNRTVLDMTDLESGISSHKLDVHNFITIPDTYLIRLSKFMTKIFKLYNIF